MNVLKTLFSQENKIITDLNVLQQISRKTSFDECGKLDLFSRLRKAALTGWTKSYGLAACQIGILLSAFYYELEGEIVEVINPEILEKKLLFVARSEGCLSFPNVRIDTYRYKSIIVSGDFRITKKNETKTYLNQKFSLDGLKAHIYQHEQAHCVGKTLYDFRAKNIETFKRDFPKIGRNSPCICGSSKKWKHCCKDIYEAQENLNAVESKI